FKTALAEKTDSKYKDVWYDDILRNLDVNSVWVEEINSASHLGRRGQAIRPADMSLSGLNLLTGIARRVSVDGVARTTADLIESSLRSDFGEELFPRGWALRRIQHFEAQ